MASLLLHQWSLLWLTPLLLTLLTDPVSGRWGSRPRYHGYPKGDPFTPEFNQEDYETRNRHKALFDPDFKDEMRNEVLDLQQNLVLPEASTYSPPDPFEMQLRSERMEAHLLPEPLETQLPSERLDARPPPKPFETQLQAERTESQLLPELLETQPPPESIELQRREFSPNPDEPFEMQLQPDPLETLLPSMFQPDMLQNRHVLDSSMEQFDTFPKNITGLGKTISVGRISYVAVGKFCRDERKERKKLEGYTEEECATHCTKDSPHCLLFSFDGQQCTLFQETEGIRIPCPTANANLIDFYFQHTLNGQGHRPATNVAIKRETDSSGACLDGDASLAVDGRIDGGFFSSCEGQTYPWWRLDLGKVYQVFVVVIADENIQPRVLLHDLVVRIGYIDIAHIKPDDKIFQDNAVCISLVERILAPGLHRMTCRTPLEGKYVSIQMVKSCGDLRGCDRPNENILRLSEVEVWARPLTPDSRVKLHNVALGKLAKQSSQSPGSTAALAIDGILTNSMKDENTGVLHCTKTKDEGEANPWWQVDLIDQHVVKKVIIFNRGEGVSARLHDFQIRVGNEDISESGGLIFTANDLCIEVFSQVTHEGPTQYHCKKTLLKGRFVSIQIIRPCETCKHSPLNILTLCEVEVMGYRSHLGINLEEENVALLQPTRQSSQKGERGPGLAVDGYIPITSVEDGQQRCTRITDSEEAFPWWRVDLSEVYVVKKITLFVDDPGFALHIVEIRVGGADIVLASPRTKFSLNKLCTELGGSAPVRAKADATMLANGGHIDVVCTKQTEGRFVSLQVVRACGSTTCDPDSINILSLCEVRVYGHIKEPEDDATNIALHHVSIMSSQYAGHMAGFAVDGSRGTNREHCAVTKLESFPWWLVDLGTPHLISSISMYNTPDVMNWHLHDVQIRVGFVDSLPSEDSFNQSGAVCGELLNQQLPVGRSDIICSKPLPGRFVIIQIVRPCQSLSCVNPDSNQLVLCEVQVMGKALTPLNMDARKHGQGPQALKAIQMLKPNNVTGHYEQVNPNAVKAFCYSNPLYRPPSICPSTTETGLDLYPWWRVDLGEECHVYKVIIHNTDKLYHAHLHDFEIRVGNEDIWRQPRNSVFTGNALCISFAHSLLPPGYSVLKCSESHTGRFVSIQIVRACQIDACRYHRVNILSLCQVVVWGAPPNQEHLGLHNVALMKDVEQSSLAKGGMPSWAVDGIFSEEIKKFDLKGNIVLKKLNLINNGKKAVRLQDVQIRIHEVDVPSDTVHILLSHGLCITVPTFTLLPGTNPMSCEHIPRGRYVTVLFKIICEGEECDDPQSGLSEVEIWGQTENETQVELTNVALHHPAEQSSLYMHGAAWLAVDGKVPSLKHKNDHEDTLHCTSTARIGRDLLPWWRVDLHQVFYIHKVVIFHQGADGQSNLHDLQIRVGKLDISKTPYNSIFESNPMCAYKDEMLPGGRHDFACDPPLRGRFVSIQIVGEGCEKCPLTKNVLSLCEVEVWASPTNIVQRNTKNVALHKPVRQSSTSVRFQNALADLAVDGYYDINFQQDDLVQCSLTDETELYPWWRVDLMGEYMVETIMLYNRIGPEHSRLHDLEIRVGEEDIHLSQVGFMDRNVICVQTPGEMLPAGETELDCSEPITGRYVTIQIFKNCNYEKCPEGPNVLSLCEVEVLGTPRPHT